MVAKRMRAVARWCCGCMRCGHQWESKGPAPPARCASCTSRYWQIPPGVTKLGRPKTKKGK